MSLPRLILPRSMRFVYACLAFMEIGVCALDLSTPRHNLIGLVPGVLGVALLVLSRPQWPHRRGKLVPVKDTRSPQERARDLLVSRLSPSQLADFDKHMCFTVRGSNGLDYVIHCKGSISGNVVRHSLDGPWTLCAAPRNSYRDHLPCWDVYLAQAIKIATDAPDFDRVAVTSAGDAYAGRRSWGARYIGGGRYI